MRKRLGTTAFWGLADQSLSSLTNFSLTLLAARSLSTQEFGAFALVFAAYLVALGVSRAISSEPLTVRYSAAPPDERRPRIAESAGSAVVLGFLSGLVFLGAGFLVEGQLRNALWAISPFLPGLLLQDAWRFSFFAAREEAKATANDLVWAIVLAGLLFWLFLSGRSSLTWFAIAWGAAGSMAALVGLGQTGAPPAVHHALGWWRAHRGLGLRYLGEFGALIGAWQLSLYVIALIAGLGAVGALRAAQVLLGPLNVLFMGVALVAVPEAVRVRSQSISRLLRFSRTLSIGLAVPAFAWGALLLSLPSGWGTALLGESWHAARPLLLPATVATSGTAILIGAWVGIRALADARRGFRARLVQSGAAVAGASAGAWIAGVQGAAWGLAASVALADLVWWYLFHISLRQSTTDDTRSAMSSAGPVDPFSGHL